jgi:hypothetical protein
MTGELRDFFDVARTQAARADADALAHALDESVNALQIRQLDLLGLDVRMAHVVTDEPTFATHFTRASHDNILMRGGDFREGKGDIIVRGRAQVLYRA